MAIFLRVRVEGLQLHSQVLPARRQIDLAFLGLLRPARLRLGCAGSTEPMACTACQLGIQDTGATRNSVEALLHAAAGACFVFVVCCSVGVPAANVGIYVCGVLWCAAASPQFRRVLEAPRKPPRV